MKENTLCGHDPISIEGEKDMRTRNCISGATSDLHVLSNIAPPIIRSSVSQNYHTKQSTDPCHSLYPHHQPVNLCTVATPS